LGSAFNTGTIFTVSIQKEPLSKNGEEIARIIFIAKKFGVCLVTASVLAELAFDLVRRQQ
jgi:hypothetical protein